LPRTMTACMIAAIFSFSLKVGMMTIFFTFYWGDMVLFTFLRFKYKLFI